VRKALAVGLPLLAAWLVAASALFVWPHDDGPIAGRADVVVSLAGSASRLPVAERLVADGVAPVLAVSLDGSPNNRESEELCRDPRPRLVCFRADPISTRARPRRSSDSHASAAGTTWSSSRRISTCSARG